MPQVNLLPAEDETADSDFDCSTELRQKTNAPIIFLTCRKMMGAFVFCRMERRCNKAL